jgi:crotonobetainyl-CoA:carnitine CoA-transferase CaiB-like acyl-CoA transferase
MVPGFPIRFADQAPEADLVTPNLGQHNGDVLTGLLAYDAERIADLEAQGVIGSKDR